VNAEPMRPAGAPDVAPEAGDLVRRDLSDHEAALLGDPADGRDQPAELGPARGVEQEVRPPQWARRCCTQLPVQGGVGREAARRAPAVEAFFEDREMLVGRTVGGHREEQVRPRDRVLERGEAVERSVALGLGHELEAQGRELETAHEPALDAEGIILDRGAWPPIEDRRGRLRASWHGEAEAAHGAPGARAR